LPAVALAKEGPVEELGGVPEGEVIGSLQTPSASTTLHPTREENGKQFNPKPLKINKLMYTFFCDEKWEVRLTTSDPPPRLSRVSFSGLGGNRSDALDDADLKPNFSSTANLPPGPAKSGDPAGKTEPEVKTTMLSYCIKFAVARLLHSNCTTHN
jgi:hypothetical protein